MNANTRWTILLCLLAMVLAALVAFVLTRRITQPLEQLSAEMQRIANFELKHDDHPLSLLSEIRVIQLSLVAMKRGLNSFGKYVSSDVVRSLIQTNREAVVGVEPANVTVFFSDIVDFTRISETLPHDDLMEVVSEYLDEMSSVIVYSGATLDKYIGDAIMAFWNAPRPMSHHPIVACEAALDCLDRLKILQPNWVRRGLPALNTRIGLHTGPVLVGNVGFDKRMDYTILGDTVNLASRLEGLNKRYGTQIIISGELFNEVKQVFVCRPLDVVAVKGRSGATWIFELVAHRDVAQDEQLQLVQLYTEALELYLKHDFASAGDALANLLEIFPDDVPSQLLAGRCHEYEADPPQEWDGVYVHLEK